MAMTLSDQRSASARDAATANIGPAIGSGMQ